MKIMLKTSGLRINLRNIIGMEATSVSSVIMMRQLSILFFQCSFAISIWSNIYIPYIHHEDLRILFGNWLTGVDNNFKLLIRVREITIIWLIWLCRNDKKLMIIIFLSYKLSTGAQLHSIHRDLYNVWSITICLRRYLHG
jgi:ABC-type Mn2+/Zn2+ transport system permease subunit